MVTTVEMPKLGNTVEDCLIAAWRKHKGDTVAAGDVIAEIETDKTNFDLTAPVDGVLLETFFEEGALVPVFTVICAIGAAGDKVDAAARRPPAAGRRGCRRAGQRPGRAPAGSRWPEGAAPDVTAPRGTARRSPARAHRPGRNGAAPRARRSLSPRARRFAREHDIDPSSVEGTGPHGRALEDDLRRAAAHRARPASGPRGPWRPPARPAAGAGTGPARLDGGQASPGPPARPAPARCAGRPSPARRCPRSASASPSA